MITKHEHNAEIEYGLDSEDNVWRRFVCSCGDSSDWEKDTKHSAIDVGLSNDSV